MKKLTFFLLASIFFVFTGTSYAGFTLSLYGGGAFPEKNITATSKNGAGTFGTITLDNSFTSGIKLGYYWPIQKTENSLSIGLELDNNVQTPDWTQVVTRNSGFFARTTTEKRNTLVFSQIVNGLVRYPVIEKVRLYAGGGAGYALWYVGDTQNTTTFGATDDASTAFAWDVLAGVDFKVNSLISLFLEYKYMGANFTFSSIITGVDMDVDYRASQAMGGLTFNF